jgi:hypothetical protein
MIPAALKPPAVGLIPIGREPLDQVRKRLKTAWQEADSPSFPCVSEHCDALIMTTRDTDRVACHKCGLLYDVTRDKATHRLRSAELILRTVCGPMGPSEAYADTPYVAEQREAVYHRFCELKAEMGHQEAILRARAEWLVKMIGE